MEERLEGLVIDWLKKIAEKQDRHQERTDVRLASIEANISALNVKTALWGALSGSVGYGMMALATYMLRK